MKILAVTRHAAAQTWLLKQFPDAEIEVSAHYKPGMEAGKDAVVGILPVNLVADLNRIGVRFLMLVLDVPAELRGVELTVAQMNELGARLEEYHCTLCNPTLAVSVDTATQSYRVVLPA